MPNYAQAAISVRQKKERGLEKPHLVKTRSNKEKPHGLVKTRSNNNKERQVQTAW